MEAMEARTHTSTLEESAIIERIARIVFSVRGTKPDYTRLAAELEQAVPFDVFGVVLLRHDRQAVRVTVCQRETDVWVARHHQHPLSDSKLEQMLGTPKLMVQDYPQGLDGVPALSGDALSGYHQLRSTLIAPLVVEDRVLGTLELGSTGAHTYAEETLQRLVNAVVRVLATAIESVQLGGNAAIQDRQRQALKDVTSALTSKMDLPTILNQIVSGIADALTVASLIVLFDPRTGRLRLGAQAGLDQQRLNTVFTAGLHVSEQCIIGQTILHHRPFVAQNITCDENFSASSASFSTLGMQSVFSYPLLTGTTVYGALLLCSPEPGGFTPLKVDILALFANQATVAIHNGMLLESVHQRSRFQEAIEQLELAHKRRLAGSLTQDSLQDELALLEHVRKETQRTLGFSFTSLLRFISNDLLTQSERDLQAVFYTEESDETLKFADWHHMETTQHAPDTELEPSSSKDASRRDHKDPFVNSLALLAQTAEAALTRAAMFGELSRLLTQLKQSTDWVNDAWFVLHLDGTCTYMNPAAEAFCGLHTGSMSYGRRLLATPSVQGQHDALNIADVFAKLRPRMRNVQEVDGYLQDFSQSSNYRQEVRCVLAAELIAHRETTPKRSSSQDSAASDYHYQFIRYPLYNQQGQLEMHALHVHDVTEQVRDDKNRSALLSSVSHDLRTPLTTIKAAVTGLLQTDVIWDEQDRRGMLEDIDSETDHLTVMVSALVELSRIEMGALILEKEWCDVVEVFHGAASKLTRTLAGRSVRTHFQSPLPLIYADHVQIERVFYNLLENAARRSPTQAEVVLHLDTVDDGTELLRAQFIDQGPLIPEDERERIFTSFYTSPSYENSMGLAICRGIIEAHQGQIWADGTTNAGSRIVFLLPIHPHTVVHAERDSISGIRKHKEEV